MDCQVLHLSHSFSLSLSDYLPTYLSIFYASICPSIYLSIHLSLSLSFFHLSVCPSIYVSELPQVVRTPWVFYFLTSKCASRCKRRALFRYPTHKKCSDHGVLCAFSLRALLLATTACKKSALIWPAGSASAALASFLFNPPEPEIIGEKKVFCELPTFSRICVCFLRTLSLLIFSLLFLFSLPLPCSVFHLSILSKV